MKLVARYTLDFYLVKSKIYEGDFTPTTYDPQTLKQSEPYYIVKCDGGKYRKFMAKHFLTLEEWRDSQLNKIL
jgi:hypothetical protein